MIPAGTIVAEARGFLRGLPPSGRVMVSVLESLGGNRYRLAFAGRRFVAQSGAPLRPGTRFYALVQIRNGRLELSRVDRHVPAATPPRPIAAEGLATRFTEGALAAAIRSRLPLDDTTLRILGRLSDDRRRSRTAATLIAKGLQKDDQSIERLSDLLVAPTGDGTGSGDGGERRHMSGNGEDDGEGTRGGETLATYLQRRTKRPNHPLQLYNHLRPQGDDDRDHWVIIPLGAVMAGGRYDGVLRLCVDLETGRTKRYTVEITSGSGTQVVAHRDNRGRTTVEGSAISDEEHAVRDLLRRLERRGIPVEAASPGDDFDGFDAEKWRHKAGGWSGTV